MPRVGERKDRLGLPQGCKDGSSHVAICTPTDGGLTLIAAFLHRSHVGQARSDPAGALERFLASRPDGPDLSAARSASKVAQAYDYPQIRRHPTPRPELALIGDAATTGDPLPAVGCGWAFRSAEWLADATIPALQGHTSLRRGLASYRRAHRFIQDHDALCRAESRALPPGRLEQLILQAVPSDRQLSRAAYRLRMRIAPVRAVRNPRTRARAAWIATRPAMQSAPVPPGFDTPPIAEQRGLPRARHDHESV